jgi:hypothetical protein
LGTSIFPNFRILEIRQKYSLPAYRLKGGLRQLSVGLNSVWGVNADAQVNVRLGIAEDTPLGKEWATVDGEPMKQVRLRGEERTLQRRSLHLFKQHEIVIEFLNRVKASPPHVIDHLSFSILSDLLIL